MFIDLDNSISNIAALHGFVCDQENPAFESWFEESYQEPVYMDDDSNPVFAFISHISVDENERGKGFGNQLMRSFLESCNKHNVNYIFLDANREAENKFDLIEWYKGFGFVELDFDELSSCVLMMKTLTE